MTYHIMTKEMLTHFMTGTRFSGAPIGTCHYIDLPDGTVLVKAVWTHPNRQQEAEVHPDVISLPHPSSSEPVGAGVAKILAHLGVQESHRTHDVAKLAAKIHPLMRLH